MHYFIVFLENFGAKIDNLKIENVIKRNKLNHIKINGIPYKKSIA